MLQNCWKKILWEILIIFQPTGFSAKSTCPVWIRGCHPASTYDHMMKCPGEFISQETRWVYNMQRKPYILRYLEVVSEKWCNKNRAGSGVFQGLATDPIDKKLQLRCSTSLGFCFPSQLGSPILDPSVISKSQRSQVGTPWMVSTHKCWSESCCENSDQQMLFTTGRVTVHPYKWWFPSPESPNFQESIFRAKMLLVSRRVSSTGVTATTRILQNLTHHAWFGFPRPRRDSCPGSEIGTNPASRNIVGANSVSLGSANHWVYLDDVCWKCVVCVSVFLIVCLFVHSFVCSFAC